MAFLEDFFRWMDSKVERVNPRDMTEKSINIQNKTKEKLAPLMTRNSPNRKSRKELSRINKDLRNILQDNNSEKEWVENERENQLDINDYEREANNASNNMRRRRMVLNIHKSLLALHQKFVSLKSSTITENDVNAINKLFNDVRINIGILPPVKPFSDDFARIIISINDIISSQGVNSGTVNVLIDLSNGALAKFNVLKSKI